MFSLIILQLLWNLHFKIFFEEQKIIDYFNYLQKSEEIIQANYDQLSCKELFLLEQKRNFYLDDFTCF